MFIPVWIIVVAAGLVVLAIAVVLRMVLRMRRGAATFRAVAEGSSDGLVLMEQDSKIIWANDAYCRNMGYKIDELLGRYPLEFALPPELAWSKEDARAFRFDPKDERFGGLTRMPNVRANGEEFIHEFSQAVVKTGKDTRFLLSGRDITKRMEREQELIEAQEKLRLLSHQDSLTGLSNRHCLAQVLADLVSSGDPFAVLQIDMNDFKVVNDTFGHAAGDALLAHFAGVLKSLAEEDWHCARVGGDEFTVLIPGVWALGVALSHASRIFAEAQVPMTWQSGELMPSISVGAAVFNGQGQSPKDVLARADVALYAAKKRQPERVAGFDDAMHRDHRAKLALHRDFSEALAQDNLGVELEPVIDVAQHKLLRFELRPVWDHPVHGHLPEWELRKIALQLCQADALDHRMVQCARDCLVRFRARGVQDVGVGLSLTEGALTSHSGQDEMAWLLDDDHFDPIKLALTFPGQCLGRGSDLSAFKTALMRLSDAGVRVYLDNPGLDVGWVVNLSDVSLEGIALHRWLVEAVDTDKTARALVTAGAGLAAMLGQTVAAHGLERPAQICALQEVGCVELSGPAVAPPMPLDGALDWMKNDWPRWSVEEAETDLSA